MAAEISCETFVPRSWNSGMAMYCTPTHGCGCTPGCSTLTSSMADNVCGAKAAAASLYSGISYVDVRVPGGTRAQPSSEPTSSMYSFDVAQDMKRQAASFFSEVSGMASD